MRTKKKHQDKGERDGNLRKVVQEKVWAGVDLAHSQSRKRWVDSYQ